MNVEKIFEGLNIEPVQDRKKGDNLWSNYELFTYDDVIEAMNAVKNLELNAVVQVCEHCQDPENYYLGMTCEHCNRPFRMKKANGSFKPRSQS